MRDTWLLMNERSLNQKLWQNDQLIGLTENFPKFWVQKSKRATRAKVFDALKLSHFLGPMFK